MGLRAEALAISSFEVNQNTFSAQPLTKSNYLGRPGQFEVTHGLKINKGFQDLAANYMVTVLPRTGNRRASFNVENLPESKKISIQGEIWVRDLSPGTRYDIELFKLMGGQHKSVGFTSSCTVSSEPSLHVKTEGDELVIEILGTGKPNAERFVLYTKRTEFGQIKTLFDSYITGRRPIWQYITNDGSYIALSLRGAKRRSNLIDFLSR